MIIFIDSFNDLFKAKMRLGGAIHFKMIGESRAHVFKTTECQRCKRTVRAADVITLDGLPVDEYLLQTILLLSPSTVTDEISVDENGYCCNKCYGEKP